MSGIGPWLLGAILGALFFYPAGWITRVVLQRAQGKGAKSPCLDEIYGALSALGEGADKLRDGLADALQRVTQVETRMQLVDQEWSDFYSKSRAIEERIAKREQRAKARQNAGEEPEDAGDDQVLAEIIRGGSDSGVPDETLSPAARAFLLKRRGR